MLAGSGTDDEDSHDCAGYGAPVHRARHGRRSCATIGTVTGDVRPPVGNAVTSTGRSVDSADLARFFQVFAAAPVGIVISDLDGAIVQANRAFAALVGREPAALVGTRLDALFHPEDASTLGMAYKRLTHGELPRTRCQLQDAEGETRWAYLARSALHDAEGVRTHHVTVIEDLTELHLVQERLTYQGLHDMLTGLPNEQYFLSRLEEVLARADPSDSVTICAIDLDSFDVVNDGLGTEVGDRLLQAVAGRLQSLVAGERAMVARFCGGRFAVLIEDSPTMPDLGTLAASVNTELGEPVYLGEHGLSGSAGVGVVRRPAGGITAAELLRSADATLRRAKRSGRGQWGLHDPDADAVEQARSRLAAVMPVAWENGDVRLEYQPLIGMHSGDVVALQALVQWNDAGHQECLALAEQTGLVLSIGGWMLREACRQLAWWSEQLGDRAPLLRVDLTPHLSHDPDLIAVLRSALDGLGVTPDRLRIGVPVAALASGRDAVEDNVRVLADLGTGVVALGAAAGPGYFTYLEDLPVRAVEIAPHIVERLARGHTESVVAQAVRQAIPLVHDCAATVIVADIDTVEQAEWWRSAGADTARGACYGAAVTPDEAVDLVRAHRAQR